MQENVYFTQSFLPERTIDLKREREESDFKKSLSQKLLS